MKSTFSDSRAITTMVPPPFFAFCATRLGVSSTNPDMAVFSISPCGWLYSARFYSFSDHLFKYRLYRPAHAG